MRLKVVKVSFNYGLREVPFEIPNKWKRKTFCIISKTNFSNRRFRSSV